MIKLLYSKTCSIDFGHPVTFSKRNYYGTDVIFIPLTSNNHPGTNRGGIIHVSTPYRSVSNKSVELYGTRLRHFHYWGIGL